MSSNIITRSDNFVYLLCIHWDTQDTSYSSSGLYHSVAGRPNGNTIFISSQEMNFSTKHWEDFGLKSFTVVNSQDYLGRRSKINTLKISLNNSENVGKRVSERLGNILNANCVLFRKNHDDATLSSCDPLYLGAIHKTEYNDEKYEIYIEDFSEDYFSAEIPKHKVPDNIYMSQRDINKPIPMSYGYVDKFPVPLQVGTDQLNAGTQYIGYAKLFIDNRPHQQFSMEPQQVSIGNTNIYYDPVYIYDEGYYNVVKNCSHYVPNAYSPNNYEIINVNNAPRIIFGGFNDGWNFGSGEINPYGEVEEINYENYVNDSFFSLLRLQIAKAPNSISVESMESPETVTGALWSVDSFQNQNNYEQGLPDLEVNFDNAIPLNMNFDTDSFIEIGGLMSYVTDSMAPAEIIGLNCAQFTLDFNVTGLNFSGDIVNMSDNQILLKFKSSSSIGVLLESKYNTWTGEPYALELDTSYSPSNAEVSHIPSSKIFGCAMLSSNPRYPMNLYGNTNFWGLRFDELGDGEELGNVAIPVGETINSDTDIDDNYIASATERARSGMLSGRWANVEFDNITGEDGVKDLMIGSSGSIYTLGFGASWTQSLDSRPDPDVEPQTFKNWFHDVRLRLYSVFAIQNLTIRGLKERKFTIRNAGGRRIDVGTQDQYSSTPSTILADIIVNEVGVDESSILNLDETYTREMNDFGANNLKYFSFALTKFTEAKKLIKDLMHSTKLQYFFTATGKFKFLYHLDKQNQFNKKEILAEDVIRYKFSRTSKSQIVTKFNLKYNYDYMSKRFRATQEYTVTDLVAGYDMNYYNLSDRDSSNQETHRKSSKTLTSKFIRSKKIYDIDVAPEINEEDGYATRFCKYMLLQHCQQRIKISLTLPNRYNHLEIGDKIMFNDLIGNLKAYNYDYTKLAKINGQWVYPVFIIEKVSKNFRNVRVNAIQLICTDPDVASNSSSTDHGWTTAEVTIAYGCTNPQAINYDSNATEDDGTCYFDLPEEEDVGADTDVDTDPDDEQDLIDYETGVVGSYDVSGNVRILGDANTDGLVNVVDLVNMASHIMGTNFLSPQGASLSDVNEDGTINVVDMVYLVNDIFGGLEDQGYINCEDPTDINYNTPLPCGLTHNICNVPQASNYYGSMDDYFEVYPWTAENEAVYGPWVAWGNPEVCNFDFGNPVQVPERRELKWNRWWYIRIGESNSQEFLFPNSLNFEMSHSQQLPEWEGALNSFGQQNLTWCTRTINADLISHPFAEPVNDGNESYYISDSGYDYRHLFPAYVYVDHDNDSATTMTSDRHLPTLPLYPSDNRFLSNNLPPIRNGYLLDLGYTEVDIKTRATMVTDAYLKAYPLYDNLDESLDLQVGTFPNEWSENPYLWGAGVRDEEFDMGRVDKQRYSVYNCKFETNPIENSINFYTYPDFSESILNDMANSESCLVQPSYAIKLRLPKNHYFKLDIGQIICWSQLQNGTHTATGSAVSEGVQIWLQGCSVQQKHILNVAPATPSMCAPLYGTQHTARNTSFFQINNLREEDCSVIWDKYYDSTEIYDVWGNTIQTAGIPTIHFNTSEENANITFDRIMTYEGMEDWNALLQQYSSIYDTGGYGTFDNSMFLEQVEVVLCFAFFTPWGSEGHFELKNVSLEDMGEIV